jgi:phosphatidylglycerophosphatase A
MSSHEKRRSISISLRDPVHFLAFGFGAGLAPKAPGTFGTLAAIPLYLLLLQLPVWGYVVFLLLALVAGVWICGESARRIGVHDHSGIVWDEIACFLLTLLPFVPSVTAVVVGFLAFRLFDVLKPWPIRWLDRHVHGGLGIMLDDVGAALMAIVLMIALGRVSPANLLLRSW